MPKKKKSDGSKNVVNLGDYSKIGKNVKNAEKAKQIAEAKAKERLAKVATIADVEGIIGNFNQKYAHLLKSLDEKITNIANNHQLLLNALTSEDIVTEEVLNRERERLIAWHKQVDMFIQEDDINKLKDSLKAWNSDEENIPIDWMHVGLHIKLLNNTEMTLNELLEIAKECKLPESFIEHLSKRDNIEKN